MMPGLLQFSPTPMYLCYVPLLYPSTVAIAVPPSTPSCLFPNSMLYGVTPCMDMYAQMTTWCRRDTALGYSLLLLHKLIPYTMSRIHIALGWLQHVPRYPDLAYWMYALIADDFYTGHLYLHLWLFPDIQQSLLKSGWLDRSQSIDLSMYANTRSHQPILEFILPAECHAGHELILSQSSLDWSVQATFDLLDILWSKHLLLIPRYWKS